MSTHETELTVPTDLCLPGGVLLDPAARAWSRTPLHRDNLGPFGGRNKRWDYWAVLAGDLVLSAVVADLDTFGLAEVWWADVGTGESGGRSLLLAPGEAPGFGSLPGSVPRRVAGDGLVLDLSDGAGGTTLTASWTELDGRAARCAVEVEQPAGHESLNVVVPWSDEVFNFTSKHQARPATGELVVGGHRRGVGGPDGPAWGVLDVGRGRWPAEITWNWGGGAGRVGAHVVGLQFGAKWTEGSGATENGLLVDGRLSKIGRELVWEYDWDAPMEPWQVTDPGGQLDVVLTPRYDKHSALDAGDLGSETHQVFGTWSGRLLDDDGAELGFDGLQGFAEEARQRW